MAKAPKRAFVCNECGADYPRWQGQCSACHAWNTITEVRGVAASPSVARNERLSGYAGNAGVAKVQKLSDISLEELPRFSTGFKEFDRVLGGAASESRMNLTGQMNLFSTPDDGGEAVDTTQLVLPDVEEFTRAELMAMERETTGLYLTGHPMDAYRALAQQAKAIEDDEQARAHVSEDRHP